MSIAILLHPDKDLMAYFISDENDYGTVFTLMTSDFCKDEWYFTLAHYTYRYNSPNKNQWQIQGEDSPFKKLNFSWNFWTCEQKKSCKIFELLPPSSGKFLSAWASELTNFKNFSSFPPPKCYFGSATDKKSIRDGWRENEVGTRK